MEDEAQNEEQNEEQSTTEDGIIPIETIEAHVQVYDDSVVPQVLDDDPIAGDGSAGREGVEVSPWRLHVLPQNRLESMAEPYGNDRRARKSRRAHERSKEARDDNRRKSRGRWRVTIAFLLGAAIVSVGAVGVTYALEMWGGKTIPFVVGSTQEKAEHLLKEKGFVVTSKTELADTVEGHVVSISPAQGKRVEEGTEVTLSISQNRIVPEVVGKGRDEAEEVLQAMGAEEIRIEQRISLDEKGKVLEVRPAAGSPFMSTEEVTLVVSELPVVPDVVSQEEGVALSHLERMSIPANVVYERAGADQRMHVIRTEPEAGKEVGASGVTVVVGDALIDPLRLSDYFDASGAKIAEFLSSEAYAPKMAHLTSDGHLVARFEDSNKASISFSKEPWSRAVLSDKTSYQNVMGADTRVEGVRLTVPVESQWVEKKEQASSDASSNKSTEKQSEEKKLVHRDVHALGLLNPTVGEETANDVMTLCGFKDVIGSCTQDTIVLPKGVAKTSAPFYCCYGEVGKHVWAILIKGYSGTGKVAASEIVAICVPKSAFASTDLKSVGEKVCDFVAYQDIYKG